MREKLIDLICEAMQEEGCIQYCNYPPCCLVQDIADHLIARGVTIQDREEIDFAAEVE